MLLQLRSIYAAYFTFFRSRLLSVFCQMQNRISVFLLNLKPAKMRGVMSEGMIMCASSPDKVEIIDPPNGVEIGDRVTVEGYPGMIKSLMYRTNFSFAHKHCGINYL